MVAAGALLALVTLASLRYGSIPLTTTEAWNALFRYDPDLYEQTVVRHLRLPRTLIGVGMGAALAGAGAAIQAASPRTRWRAPRSWASTAPDLLTSQGSPGGPAPLPEADVDDALQFGTVLSLPYLLDRLVPMLAEVLPSPAS